jgi:hypothetical protein
VRISLALFAFAHILRPAPAITGTQNCTIVVGSHNESRHVVAQIRAWFRSWFE